MTSTSRHLRSGPDPGARGREFEKLRNAFNVRLASDRANLKTLEAALARADRGAALTFEKLQFSAHRIHGAAAVFETFEVASAASALEAAAASALFANADKSDLGVSKALQNLLEVLARVISE
jgi:hypothetical protein